MRLVDANVLLYAVDEDAQHHAASRRWLDEALSGGDAVGLSWIAMLAFVRLTTKVGLYPNPLTVGEAMDQVEAWIATPGAQVVHPTSTHSQTLARLLGEVGSGGNLVNDAHLAAMAVEQRAAVVSYDNDFDRFSGVRRSTPEDLLTR